MMKNNKIIRKIIAGWAITVMTVLALCTLVMAADSYTNTETGYQAWIQDDAGLISDTEAASVLESMQPVTKYSNVMFATTNSNSSTPVQYAQQIGLTKFSGTYTVFLIDMDNRQIYIGSTADVRKSLTTAKANTITDNIYEYASKGQYALCAQEAFSEMYTILDGGNVPAPMKIIGCILIALIAGLTICYIILSSVSKTRSAGAHEIETGMGNKDIAVINVNKVLIASHFVRASSGGGGGGGGGSFGGGGGGGGFGGGGHSF